MHYCGTSSVGVDKVHRENKYLPNLERARTSWLAAHSRCVDFSRADMTQAASPLASLKVPGQSVVCCDEDCSLDTEPTNAPITLT